MIATIIVLFNRNNVVSFTTLPPTQFILVDQTIYASNQAPAPLIANEL